MAFSLFKYLGAGICTGDTCFWSFIVQSECFSFFLRSSQVDGLLWIWDGGVDFGGPIVVPAGGGGCCRACGCAGLHWRGLVIVVFLCVCGLDGCFSDSQGLYWPVWIS